MGQIKEKTFLREMFQDSIIPYLDEIFSAAVRLTQDPTEAENMVVETLAKAWGVFDQFDRSSNLRVWLYRILMSAYGRFRHKNSLESPRDNVPPEPISEFSAYNKLTKTFAQQATNHPQAHIGGLSEEEILNALKSLPDGFRETVILADFQGLSYEEIALSLDVSIEFVRFQLNVGRHYFQKALWEKADSLVTVAEKPKNVSMKSFSLEQA